MQNFDAYYILTRQNYYAVLELEFTLLIGFGSSFKTIHYHKKYKNWNQETM